MHDILPEGPVPENAVITIEPGNPERASALGQIRYSQETYRAVLRDYATSLKSQGFTRIFLMGDSGGNTRGMQEVAEELSQGCLDTLVLVLISEHIAPALERLALGKNLSVQDHLAVEKMRADWRNAPCEWSAVHASIAAR